MTLYQLIIKYKINQPELARRMNMPIGTFKCKLYPSVKSQRFTEEEQRDLLASVNDYALNIMDDVRRVQLK